MCTLEKRGRIFILTIKGSDEHRLNPTLFDAIQSALHRVRAESASSSALITTAQGKFFSNGYDLAWAGTSTARRELMNSKLQSLVTDLISLPIPTIAAVSGHASAAGFILALSHDYILMRSDRGFLYMSELDIKLVIPPWFIALVECKIGSPMARRAVVLKAAKITAKQAVELGIIDSAHDSADETVDSAVRLGEELAKRGWDGHVYGQNRMRLFAKVLDAIALHTTESTQTRSRMLPLHKQARYQAHDRTLVVVLTMAKITAKQAVELGIIDSAHDSVDETVDSAVRLGKELARRGWDGHVYSQNCMRLFAKVLDEIALDTTASTHTQTQSWM
ncbi:hypothetical protein SO802_016833 [Lithocarpus litseifolius]|uniref:Delta(3)-Delta(2)-enoyl-CoA isomerase n=1 Tax=Lithocarpus litseifolius TaxID=425828 RepID=A0AAW2CXK4_9ROSI